MIPSWLWVVFTVLASSAQTARNAMQSDLVSSVGTGGATYVRFLFGLPFVVIFLAVEWLATGVAAPMPDARALAWCATGALAQVIATALMLMAMQARSFVVTIAYTKTEPVFIAAFGIAFLHDVPSPATAAAIFIATAGVLLMSLPRAEKGGARDWKPALTGIASGAFFALSATGYRGGIIALPSASFVMSATTALIVGLLIQCTLILAWLVACDRPVLAAILKSWRPSLVAGFMGALASQLWFLAFAISSAARVRTLALIEVPFAQVVSRRVFKQGMNAPEFIGMAMIVVGVVLLVNG
jgi:drug/metabolite transporter (DMT)-like permease